jgi:hypothetical protein
MSMKNFNNTIGNRTRDLRTCSTVPQPTALPRAPLFNVSFNIILPSTPRSSKWSLSFRRTHQNPVPYTWPIGPSHLILVNMITGTVCGEKYKLWSPSLYSFHSPCITPSLWGPQLNIQHALCISECPYALLQHCFDICASRYGLQIEVVPSISPRKERKPHTLWLFYVMTKERKETCR